MTSKIWSHSNLFSPQKQQALAALNTQALTEAFKKQQMSAWLHKNQIQDVLQPAMLLNALLGAQSDANCVVSFTLYSY